jgi:EAL domain-containing protein (putative c-di-GMP-specific phosphodiesterase class I)/PAS domain-containing protein
MHDGGAGPGRDRAGAPAATAAGGPATTLPTAPAGLAGALPRRLPPLFLSFALLAVVAAGAGLLLGVLLARAGAGAVLCALAAAALAAGALAGAGALQRRLAARLRAMAGHADRQTARLGGDVPAPSRTELAALARSFDALVATLQRGAERTRRELEAETQNALDLQRQYALMQLLRNLAAMGSGEFTLASALQDALAEIGEYLDWPLARLLIVTHSRDGAPDREQAHWFAPDRARFAAFIEAAGPAPSRTGMAARAIESSLSHWFSDLARLESWPAAAAAKASGLRTGFVMPVTAAADQTAVLEFYADHRIEASDEMLELVEAIAVELFRLGERVAAGASRHPQAERARRLASLAEHLDECLLLVGADGHIEWVNEAALRWLDLAAERCLGRDPGELLFADDPAAAVELRRAVASGGRLEGRWSGGRVAPASPRRFELRLQPLPAPGAGRGAERSGGMIQLRPLAPALEAVAAAPAARRRAPAMPGLEGAWERGELELRFEPRVDFTQGRLAGAAAQLRWRRDGAVLLPEEFLPAAEEGGQLAALAEWAAEELCGRLALWRRHGLAPLPVSLQLPLRLLARTSTPVAGLRAALSRWDLGARWLQVDLSGPLDPQECEAIVAPLRELHQMGLSLCIDDFGSAGLSLEALRRLPVDAIRIERAFVRGIGSGGWAVIDAILALSRAFGWSVSAAGVQTRAQAGALRERGCALMQGELFSPALAPDEFLALARAAPADLPWQGLLDAPGARERLRAARQG